MLRDKAASSERQMSSDNGRIYDSLIIVCCHAIWLGGKTYGENESEWLIEHFQAGETPTFIEHMRAGVAMLAANDSAVLVFSGGPTKQDKTPLSEAESYRNLALANKMFGNEPLTSSSPSLSHRMFVDTYARDSYQNILFPLLQFPKYVSKLEKTLSHHQESFPQHLTIVSHDFKRRRFCELHLPALKWPASGARLRYYGIDPPFDEVKMAEVNEGDQKRGFGVWTGDLYGSRYLLDGKRVSRGWTNETRDKFREEIVEKLGKDDREVMEHLMEWKGGETGMEVFPRRLPWE